MWYVKPVWRISVKIINSRKRQKAVTAAIRQGMNPPTPIPMTLINPTATPVIAIVLLPALNRLRIMKR